MVVEQTPYKSQHKKLTLENKILLPFPALQPSDHESGALPAKLSKLCVCVCVGGGGGRKSIRAVTNIGYKFQ